MCDSYPILLKILCLQRSSLTLFNVHSLIIKDDFTRLKSNTIYFCKCTELELFEDFVLDKCTKSVSEFINKFWFWVTSEYHVLTIDCQKFCVNCDLLASILMLNEFGKNANENLYLRYTKWSLDKCLMSENPVLSMLKNALTRFNATVAMYSIDYPLFGLADIFNPFVFKSQIIRDIF